jgi:hypothetical protein
MEKRFRDGRKQFRQRVETGTYAVELFGSSWDLIRRHEMHRFLCALRETEAAFVTIATRLHFASS